MRTCSLLLVVVGLFGCDKKPSPPTSSATGSAAAPASPAPKPALAAADPWSAPAAPAPAAGGTTATEDCKGQDCAKLALGVMGGDPANAAALFIKGCDGDDGISCAMAGVAFKEGKGVALDVKKGVSLYEKSCTLGYAKGCYNFALALANGDGVPADEARAVPILEKACTGKAWKACGSVGDYLVNKGQSAKAKPLLELGCDNGDSLSCETLAKLK